MPEILVRLSLRHLSLVAGLAALAAWGLLEVVAESPPESAQCQLVILVPGPAATNCAHEEPREAPPKFAAAGPLSTTVRVPDVSAAVNTEKTRGRGSALQQDVSAVLDENLPMLRSCYVAGRAKDSSLEGTVTVAWRIEPTGRTADVVVRSTTLENRKVERCLVRQLKGLRFAAHAEDVPVRIRHPFVLKPAKALPQKVVTATVRAEGIEVTGDRARLVELQARTEEGLRDILSCYRHGLKKLPSLSGEIRLSLLLKERGGIDVTGVLGPRAEGQGGSAANSASLSWCVNKKIRSWKTSPAEQDELAVMPLQFTVR